MAIIARGRDKSVARDPPFLVVFLVDYISAFFLAVAFTIAFAIMIRDEKFRAWRDMPPKAWLLTFASWLLGTMMVGFGALTAHWLTFVTGTAALAAIIFTLVQRHGFKNVTKRETETTGNDVHPAVALYFCITLLLFFCAISVRFYVINLA